MSSDGDVTSSPFSIDGARALVTGASRGLGQAIAIALADAGADIACVSSKAGGAAQTAATIREMGRTAWELVSDLSVRANAASLAEKASAEMGRIDILVNNAGTIRREPAAQHSADNWDTVIRTNLD